MTPHEETFDLAFRVAVYRDGDDWAAHALELDIVGCGDTQDEALNELVDLIECQVSFALQVGDASLICREAPPEVFEGLRRLDRGADQARVGRTPHVRR